MLYMSNIIFLGKLSEISYVDQIRLIKTLFADDIISSIILITSILIFTNTDIIGFTFNKNDAIHCRRQTALK